MSARRVVLAGGGLACLASMLLGTAHLLARAWPLAWLGLACLGAALHLLRDEETQPPRPLAPRVAAAILLVRLGETAITEHWLHTTLRAYLGMSPSLAALAVVALWLMSTTVRCAPALALVALERWHRAPVSVSLALGMTLGEWAWHRAAVWSWSDHLYAHAADPVVWGALAHLRWEGCSAAVIGLGAALGEGLVARHLRRVGAVSVALVAVATLPRHTVDARVLEGVHVAAMRDLDAVVAPPPGTRLVTLPELAIARRADLAAPGVLEVPIARGGAIEVLGGGLAWSRENRLANVAWALDNRGNVSGVHLKRVLVPGGERPVFGLLAGAPFEQGATWDVLAVGGHRVLPLICIEALDRGWIATARRGGADIVAVLASDRPLMGSGAAYEQANAIARLRSVESGLTVVRASLGGAAMAFWPNGRQDAR